MLIMQRMLFVAGIAVESDTPKEIVLFLEEIKVIRRTTTLKKLLREL